MLKSWCALDGFIALNIAFTNIWGNVFTEFVWENLWGFYFITRSTQSDNVMHLLKKLMWCLFQDRTEFSRYPEDLLETIKAK